MIPKEYRALAQEERVIDAAFRLFCDAQYFRAQPDKRAALRIAFFAGVEKLLALQRAVAEAAGANGVETIELGEQVAAEIAQFNTRIAAVRRSPRRRKEADASWGRGSS